MKRFMTHFLSIFCGLLVLVACNGGGRPTPGPEETAEPPDIPVGIVQVDSEVQRITAEVWAGAPEGPENELPKLDNDDWQDLDAGNRVTTDDDGEARLNVDFVDDDGVEVDCMDMYVFKESRLFSEPLVDAPCPKPDAESAAWYCADEGSDLFIKECGPQVTIVTASGDEITLEETAVMVTYFPDQQLTLFVALEGVSQVSPSPDSDSPAGTEPFALENEYVYLVPSDAPPELQQIAGIPAGVAHPLEALGAFEVEGSFISQLTLATNTPELTFWMDQTRVRGLEEGLIIPPEFPILPMDSRFKVNVDDSLLADKALAATILQGVDWTTVTERVSETQNPPLFLAYEDGQIQDARLLTLNPNEAMTIVEEQGGIQQPITILYSEESRSLSQLAEGLGTSFAELGIETILLARPPHLLEAAYSSQLETGQPTIWLESP